MDISPDLLAILACPECKEPVEPQPGHQWLVCRRCKVKYPVQDGIPIMLLEKAQPLEE